MNTERTFQIIIADLVSDNLKHQEQLEEVINSSITIEEKLVKTKDILRNIVLSESMLSKFRSIIPQPTNNETPNTPKTDE